MKLFWRRLVMFIMLPFRLAAAFGRWLKGRYQAIGTFFTEEPEDAPLAETLNHTIENPASLLVHLDALRKHLLRATLVLILASGLAFTFNSQVMDFITRPLPAGTEMIAIDVTEPLSTVMKVSLLTGFALALPFIAFELYLFIAPGISARARRWGLLALPAVLVLFVGGMSFAFYIMLPPALSWLLQVGDIATQVRPSSYFGFITRVLFWVGLVFEFPLVIYVLASLGLVQSKTLLVNWRIAVIAIAVLAALITPTIDPFNMAIIMGPMIVLYFLSAGLAAIAQRGRTSEV